MKLHRVEVDNLNSLYGEQSLDLDADLEGAPMFLIHGRTGAGKSTLLDAVCLALFGQTPRLDRGRGDEVQPHQIMSKGTASCRATVEFSLALQGGRERYRATWSCRRARGKTDGKVQEPVRKLELQGLDAAGAPRWDTLIETDQVRSADQRFSEALRGLTVEDFKRSILLAQGEFAAFLRASEAERSTLLERLTDTGQYAAIGRRAGEVFRQKRDEVAALRTKVAGVPVLSEPDVAEARARLQGMDEQREALTQRLAALDRGLRWAEEQDQRLGRLAQAEARRARAAEALAAAGPALDRLAEHRRCQGAAGALAAVAREEAALRPLEQSLAAISAELAQQEPVAQAQAAALDAARQEQAAAEAAGAAAAPEIQQARALRQAAAAAQGEAEAAAQAAAQKAATRATQREALQQTAALREEAARRLGRATAQRAALADGEALAEHVLSWQATVTRLSAERSALQVQDRELVALQGRREQAAARARAAEGAEAEARGAVALAEARAGQATARLTPLSAGHAEPRAARRALDEARQRTLDTERRLDQLSAPLERARRSAASLLQTAADGAAVEAEQRALGGRLPDLEALVVARQAAAQATKSAWVARRLVLELADRRDALHAGAPCPLCGSLEHPWRGQPLEADAAAAEQGAAAAHRAAEAAEQEARAALSGVKAQQRQLDQRAEPLRRRLASQRQDFRAAALALDEGLRAVGLGSRSDEIESNEIESLVIDITREEAVRRAAAVDARATWERSLALLDAAIEEEQGAREALAAARQGHGAQQRAALAAQGEEQRAAEALAQADQQRAERAGRFDEERRALHAALEGAGLPAAEGALKLKVAEAAQRVSDWRAAASEEQAAREALNTAEIGLAAAQRGAEESAAAAEEAQQRAQGRAAQAAAAIAAARQALGGQDPDALERSLKDRLARAEAAARLGAERLEATRLRCSQLQGRQESARAQREELAARLAGAQDALAQALAALGLTDRAALAARLLEAEALARLAAQEQDLLKGLAEASARAQEAAAALDELRAARPEGAPEGPEPREAARASRDALAEQQSRLLQARGALTERLEQHEQNLARQGALRASLEAAAQELDTWEQIYGLIGTNNGEAFKKYAQILNLEDLLQRANERLQWLAPRYLLAPARGPNGEERLAFAVQDEHHAWEARPLTTLSGGETFLVSLSLALALAEYRTLQAPIETLLLDEGFGTLDTDTLNTVMDALEKLQSRGARVGLISHVEALRERVEARVAVEAVGHGRSRLRVELGAGKAGALRIA